MHTSACTYSKGSVTCPCVCWVVAYLWLLPITYNRMVYLCVADKRMHDRRAWYSKPGKKPTKEVPPNVDALVHAATLAAHDLAVAEFGPALLKRWRCHCRA